MTAPTAGWILTINTGSSSLKAGLHRADEPGQAEVSAVADRIGAAGGRLRVRAGDGSARGERHLGPVDHVAALGAVLDWLAEAGEVASVAAIGHRFVHGGRTYAEPRRVSAALLAAVDELVPLAPDHLPQALAAVATLGRVFPDVPQVACFDTAFHRTLPRVARIYPLPHDLEARGVVRYGFHGLSYESVVARLRAADADGAAGRVVVAHLGNGASMVALRDGAAVDTTMGFTPSGGLMMGTRSGDLDPGVLLHLLRAHGMDAASLDRLVNHEAGLRGVSGRSADMRDLLAWERDDPRAADAVALFCYRAKTCFGALAAVLGGLDALVFTGGIGEHAAPVRARICAGLEFLGLRLDPARNLTHAPVVSPPGSPVTVRIVASDEDAMIASHTATVLAGGGEPDDPL